MAGYWRVVSDRKLKIPDTEATVLSHPIYLVLVKSVYGTKLQCYSVFKVTKELLF